MQAFPMDQQALEARLPITDARPMVPLPLVPEIRHAPPPVLPVITYPEIQERLIEVQRSKALAAYPPALLARHNTLGWMVARCDCGTTDLRRHHDRCPVRLQLPILEHQIQMCNQEPEEWIEQQASWGHLVLPTTVD